MEKLTDAELIAEIRRTSGIIAHCYMMARTNVSNPRAYLNKADKLEDQLKLMKRQLFDG